MEALTDIIRQLERQARALERALLALREVSGTDQPATRSTTKESAPRKRGLTPEGRRRLALLMKRRWAAKRTAGQAKKASRKRGGLTAAGRQKLAEAMRKRWAAKRSAA